MHIGRHSGTVAIGLAAAAALLAASAARAQDGRRVYQEQLRVQLDQQQSSAREAGFDAGGWFSFSLFHFDDASADRDRTLRQYQLRAWANYTLHGVHTFYLRGLGDYQDWNRGDNPQGKGDECDGKVERAWYNFDFDRMVRNETGQDPLTGFKVHVGRDFYTIGSGLVLALPLDAVELSAHHDDWAFKGLVGKTITHTANSFDFSPPVQDHMRRCFFGSQLTYKGFSRHEPYVFWLLNRDQTDEWGDDPDQEYDYDSQYIGAGSSGSFAKVPNLRYAAELVFENGKSFAEGQTSDPERVDAMALDVLLEYLFNLPKKPKVQLEYLWGSGDGDRRLSSGSTLGGNQPGTRDQAFNAFGFRDTGIAFAPRISNLHILQAGGSFFPLEQVELFKQMELGTKVFFYMKDRPGGAISDTLGTEDARWVGWEWDAYCNWRLTSDVSLTLRYGFFRPGAAFEDETCRQFVFGGVTYSF